jgi:hypothetical protein
MWMSYVRVTTTCRDGTSILIQTQDSQPVPHKVGVSVFRSPAAGHRPRLEAPFRLRRGHATTARGAWWSGPH